MMEYHGFDSGAAISGGEHGGHERSVATTDLENKEDLFDKPAGAEDVAEFKAELEAEIADKAFRLGIETKEGLDTLVDLLQLDLGYFEKYDPSDPDGEDADGTAWTGRDLSIMKENIDEALGEVRHNGDGLEAVSDPGTLEKITDFLSRHHNLLSLGELALLTASFGSSFLQSMVEADVQIETVGNKVPLGDMMKYPEIAAKMNELGSANDGQQHFGQYCYSDADVFEDNGTKFVFEVFRGAPQTLGHDSAAADQNFVQRIYLAPAGVDEESLHRFNDDLKSHLGISLSSEDNGCSLAEFSEHRAEIAHYLSEDLGVDEDKIMENIDGFIGYDANNVALVELDEFKINPDVQPSENFDSLKSYEKELAAGDGHAQFRGQFMQLLQDNDIDIDELKETAADNPEAAIRVMMGVIAENVDFDTEQKDFDGNDWLDRHDEANQAALQALESGHANCWAWTTLCIDAKLALEEEGVPNLDKVAFFPAYSSIAHHVWVAMATENAAGGVDCTGADPTMDGVHGDNAVDDNATMHSYAVDNGEFCKGALQRIQDMQALHKAEEALRSMQYDPDLDKIELKKVEDAEDAADAGAPMLRRIMERIDKLKAERDAIEALRKKL